MRFNSGDILLHKDSDDIIVVDEQIFIGFPVYKLITRRNNIFSYQCSYAGYKYVDDNYIKIGEL